MIYAGKIILSVVGGGALLGAWLGSFAYPVMKAGPQTPWDETLAAPIAVGPGNATRYIEPLPEDLTPPTVPDSYVPAIALTELPRTQSVQASLPEYGDASYAAWRQGPDDADEAFAPVEEPAPPARQSPRADLARVAEIATTAQSVAREAASTAPLGSSGAAPDARPLAPLY